MTTCNSCVVLGLVFLLTTFGSVVGVITNEQVMTYLAQYGYMNHTTKDPTIGNMMSEETVVKAIREFQSFAGLNSTGHLDNDTLRYMSMPRCGVPDKVNLNPHLGSRTRRYVLHGGKWEMNDLTYNISKYPKLLGKSETDSVIRRAFDVWSEVTPLKFTHEKYGKVNIDIQFPEGEHSDDIPFDSSYVTLSHVFYPKFSGSVHFDGSLKWSINSNEGNNLFRSAVHALGHSLGLSHSTVISSVMSPIATNYDPASILSSDDVVDIQSLYGSNPTTEKSDFMKDHGISN